MPARKILKIETKICAIWGILEANLKKSSTLKFIMYISFVPSVCIHRSIISIFKDKKYACRFFPMENIIFQDFQFLFLRESTFPWWIPGSVSMWKRPLMQRKKSHPWQIRKHFLGHTCMPMALKRLKNSRERCSGECEERFVDMHL